jgi:hypothetical protein
MPYEKNMCCEYNTSSSVINNERKQDFLVSKGSTVVEHSSRPVKVVGSSLATLTDTSYRDLYNKTVRIHVLLENEEFGSKLASSGLNKQAH